MVKRFLNDFTCKSMVKTVIFWGNGGTVSETMPYLGRRNAQKPLKTHEQGLNQEEFGQK